MHTIPEGASLLPNIIYPVRFDEMDSVDRLVVDQGLGFDIALDLYIGDPAKPGHIILPLAGERDCGGRILLYLARNISPFDRLLAEPTLPQPINGAALLALESEIWSTNDSVVECLPEQVVVSVNSKRRRLRDDALEPQVFLKINWYATHFLVDHIRLPGLLPRNFEP